MIEKRKALYLLMFMLYILSSPLHQGATDSTIPPGKTDYPEPIPHTKGFNKDNSNLPGNRIYCLSKTIDTAIWVGTDKGPVRYDKGKWQGFISEESKLQGNLVSVFFNTEDNSVWAATDIVVSRFHKGKWQPFSQERYNLPGGKVNALINGKEGKVWLGTQQGLAYFENSKWHRVMDRKGRNYKASVNTLLETENGALWVGTNFGLECLYKEEWQTWMGNRKFPNTPITTLLKTQHFLWVGNGSILGRIRVNKEAWQTSTYEEKGRLNNRIITLCETKDGSIWIGTGEKLWYFENEHFKPFIGGKGDKLKGRLSCLLDSHDGALWVGTDKGLFRIQKSRWQIFTPGNSQLPGANVRALLTMEDGTLWAGTDKGLAYFEEKEWKIFSDEESGKDIKGRGVLALAEIGSGYLWVGFEHGLVIIQNGSIREAWLEEKFNDINAFMITADKNVWFGTDKGLYRYRKKRMATIRRRNSQVPISGVNALWEAKDRTLYVGTEDGLVHRQKGEWRDVDGFEGTNITALVQMEDKALWVGSKFDEFDRSPGGLHYYKDGKRIYFGELAPDNMEKNFVTALLNENEDTLWVGTKNGLTRIHNKNKEMHLFTEGNCDLISDEITALSLGTDGVLWVGTPKGVARFRPPTWEERPYVELIKTSNKKVLTQSEQTFNASAFDPKYQTESHEFKYHWIIFSESGKIIHDKVSKNAFLTHTYQDKCRYTVEVSCIDCYGYRSKREIYSFKIAVPKMLLKIGSFLNKYLPELCVLAAIVVGYLLVLYPLILLYPKCQFVKPFVNSGAFNKFPILHKMILNSLWARRRLFSDITLFENLPSPFIPKKICFANASTTEAIMVEKDNLGQILEKLCKNRQHALICAPQGSGKTVFLRYLYNTMLGAFKMKTEKQLPVLIDINTFDIQNYPIEKLVYNAFCGYNIKLSQKIINFLVQEGNFVILIDSIGKKEKKIVRDKINTFLNTNHNLKNKIIMASRNDVLERDDINLFIWCAEAE